MYWYIKMFFSWSRSDEDHDVIIASGSKDYVVHRLDSYLAGDYGETSASRYEIKKISKAAAVDYISDGSVIDWVE